jgi:hypothetical protein
MSATRRGRQPRRPLLPDDAAALFANERIVSVDLAGKSRPATREIFQSLGFSLTLRQFHQATTFSRLIYAMLCAIHEIIPRSVSQYLKKQDRKKNDDSTGSPP